jgi:hypothetical protein
MFNARRVEITLCFAILVAFSLGQAAVSFADTLVGDTARSTEQLGNFMADLYYRPFSTTSGVLDISLKNTSPVAGGGYLTGFAFDNPFNSITGATLTGTNPSFGLLGGPAFNQGIAAQPLGTFDIGAGLGGSFTGGGQTTAGIPAGVTASFQFAFTGTNLDRLTTSNFVSPTSGEGAFAARFRDFSGGGSDKVPGKVGIPEPSTVVLLGLGMAGLLVYRKKGTRGMYTRKNFFTLKLKEWYNELWA